MSPDSRQEVRKIDLARSVNDDQVPETGIEPESRVSMYLHVWRRLAASISVVVGLSAGLLASPANADTWSDNPPWAPVPASYYANGCSVPGPNVLLDQQVFPDPSPWWFFPVYFRMACDLHDAGYDGGIVFDPDIRRNCGHERHQPGGHRLAVLLGSHHDVQPPDSLVRRCCDDVLPHHRRHVLRRRAQSLRRLPFRCRSPRCLECSAAERAATTDAQRLSHEIGARGQPPPAGRLDVMGSKVGLDVDAPGRAR